MSDQQTTTPARTRHFLEQMMMSFVNLRVPVPQAAQEMLEIEAHIEESQIDPFDEFGKPGALAASLIPPSQLVELRKRELRNNMLVGFGFGSLAFTALQAGATYFGEEATFAPTVLFFYLVAALVGQLLVVLTGRMLEDIYDPVSPKPVTIVMGLLLALAGAAALFGALLLTGANPGDLDSFGGGTQFWLITSAVSLIYALTGAFFSWRLVTPDAALIEGGITGQILYEMNNNSRREGWVHYGLNGMDLRDPDFSLREVWRSAEANARNGEN